MSKTLDQMTQNSWAYGGTAGFARYEFSDDFVDEDGREFEAGPKSYLEVPTTISGAVVTIPAYPNFPTTESAILNNGVTVTCHLLDSNRVKRTTLFEDCRIYTSLPSTISLSQLVLANGASRLLRDDDVWTKEQVIDYVGTRPPAVKMTALVHGIARLSVAAVDPADPIVVGDNDPRIANPVSSTDPRIGTPSTAYASLAAAVAAIGSTPTTLVIVNAFPSGGNVTVPRTLTLKFVSGGTLSLTTGHTIIIRGPVIATISKIFDNALASQGTISFAFNSSVETLYPQWWGAKADGRIVTRCVTVGTSATINCTDGDFTVADEGKDFTAYITTNWGRGVTASFVTSGNAGAAGIPLQGVVNAVGSATQFTSSVAASSSLSSTNSAAGVGAVASTSHNLFLGTDDTAAIQACLLASDTCGAEVYFPAGMYYIKGSGTELLRFYKAKRIAGAGSYSRLMFAASVPTTTDIIRVTPSDYYQPNGLGNEVYPLVPSQRMLSLENFTIEAVAGRPGQYGIHLDFGNPAAPYGSSMTMLLTNNILVWGTSAASVHINNNGGQTVGALAQSSFENSNFHEGITGTLIGDTVRMQNCSISGSLYAVNLSFNTGVTTFRLEHCNIVSSRGIRLVGGVRHMLIGSIIELTWADPLGVVGSNGAVIDIDMASSVGNVTVSDNYIANFTGTVADGVRVVGGKAVLVNQNQFNVAGGYGINVADTSPLVHQDNEMIAGLGLINNAGSSTIIASAARSYATIQASNDSEHIGARSVRAASFQHGVQDVLASKTLVVTGLPTDELHVSNWGVLRCDASAGNINIIVPQVNSPYMYGKELFIKNVGASGSVTFTPTVNTVEGAASVVLNAQWKHVRVLAGSAASPNWIIMEAN